MTNKIVIIGLSIFGWILWSGLSSLAMAAGLVAGG